MDQPISDLQTPHRDWLLHKFIEVNFSKLTDSNQSFMNDFVCLHFHLCKISSQIIECIIFPHYELSITTIYSMLILYGILSLILRIAHQFISRRRPYNLTSISSLGAIGIERKWVILLS